MVTATDVDSAGLTYELASGAVDGNGNPVSGLTFNPDGSYSFQGPQDFNGTVTFTYKTNDGELDSNVATVTITVDPVNDAPMAQDGNALGDEDTPILGSVTATDVDSAGLTYELVSGAVDGNGDPVSGLTFNPDGSYSFQGPQDFNGTVTFTYKTNDGALDSNVATVTITVDPVNDAPVAQDGNALGDEDTPILGSVTATDVDSAGLTYELVSGAVDGNGDPVSGLTFNPDGSYSFQGPQDFNGTVTFAYKTNDGELDSNVATVTITVDPVNDAPMAQDGNALGDEDTPILGLVTATDVDSAGLTYELASGAVDGNGNPVSGLTFNPDGSYSFQGPQDFNGTVTFTYKTNDGELDSNVATVTITVDPVNDAPMAQDGNALGDEDTPILGSVTATDVDSAGLTYELVSGAVDGNGDPVSGLTFNPDGSYSFQGPQDFNGTVTFAYKTNDGELDSNVATVTITVDPVNDAPMAQDGNALGDEDTPILGSVTATDVDSAGLTYELVSGAVDGNGNPVSGLTFNPDGSYSFQGPQDFNGTVTFTYKTNDGELDSNVATVTITVDPVNDDPVITSGSGNTATYSIIENTTAVATLTASDIDGDAVTWSILPGNEGNRFNINSSGQLTFITAPDYEDPTDAAPTNSYIVNVQASDGHGGTDTQTITVNVTNDTAGDNHPPVANDDKWLISNNTKAALPIAALLGNDTDADGNSLSVAALSLNGTTWVTDASDGSTDGVIKITTTIGDVAVNVNSGQISYDVVNSATDETTSSFYYRISDGAGGTDDGQVTTEVVGIGNGNAADTVNLGTEGAYTYSYIKSEAGDDLLTGAGGYDIFLGGSGDDNLVSGDAADKIDGDSGSDTINGGLGSDILTGGSQNDAFRFDTVLDASTNVDTITDFAANGTDKIHLDDAIFAGIANVSGKLDSNDFSSLASGGASASVGASVNIIFDQATGNLYYDLDGGSSANRMHFAHVTVTSGAVDASDFFVF